MALKDLKKRLPGRSGRLSAEQAADLPERLLDAAQILFSESGFADTSMEKIARTAGASTKTVYGRYASKGEILNAVVRRLIERTLAEVKADERVEPSRAELGDFLVSLCTGIALTVSRDGAGLHRLAFAEAHRTPELRQFYLGAVGRGTGLLQAAFERWRALGRLPHLGDPAEAAILFLSMSTDHVRLRTVLGDPLSEAEIKAYVAGATAIFLRGVGYRADPPPP